MTHKMAIVAALDTSAGAALAVRVGGRVVVNASMAVSGRESDARLANWLMEQLQTAALMPSDIELWTVGTGPGSFSGLRVGLALGMGICAASGALMHGVPSDLALARQAAAGADCATVGVLHDARQGQLILGLYRLEGSAWRELQAPAVLEPGAVAAAAAGADMLTWIANPRVDALVPGVLHARLVPQASVNASMLLDVPGWSVPAEPEAREASCQPVYVRPAVFVPPRELRTV